MRVELVTANRVYQVTPVLSLRGVESYIMAGRPIPCDDEDNDHFWIVPTAVEVVRLVEDEMEDD